MSWDKRLLRTEKNMSNWRKTTQKKTRENVVGLSGDGGRRPRLLPSVGFALRTASILRAADARGHAKWTSRLSEAKTDPARDRHSHTKPADKWGGQRRFLLFQVFRYSQSNIHCNSGKPDTLVNANVSGLRSLLLHSRRPVGVYFL